MPGKSAKASAGKAAKPNAARKPSAAKAAKKGAKPKPATDDVKEIDQQIADLGDWRGEVLARIRALIKQADPDVVEEIKWRKPSNPHGVPVWSDGGMICTGETYKDKVKFTFAQGAALPDPKRLFNASLDAGTRRAIDVREEDTVDAAAFKALIKAAAALNARG